MTGLREPGWYDDPGGDLGQLRWWDGSAWTGITRDRMPHERAAMPAPEQPGAWSGREVLDAANRPGRPTRTWLVVLGIVGLIGVLVLTGAVSGLGGAGNRVAAPPVRTVGPQPFPLPTDQPPVGPPVLPGPRPTGPVSGRVTDAAAGLSYDVLPGAWQGWDLFTFSGMLTTVGYYRVLQRDAPGGGEYWANINSGLVSPAAASRDDLVTTARRLVDGFDTAYYPAHSQHGRQERALTVDGHPAYLVRFVAAFDPAASKGYVARSEQVTVLVVDTGRQLPAVLYVSLPDTVRSLWGSVDPLLASVRVLR